MTMHTEMPHIEDGPKYQETEPVPVLDDEERLIFYNENADTLHIASLDPGRGRTWAVCNMGGRKSMPLYVHVDKLQQDSIARNGVTAEFCSNCQSSLREKPEEWQCEKCNSTDIEVETYRFSGVFEVTCAECDHVESQNFTGGRYKR